MGARHVFERYNITNTRDVCGEYAKIQRRTSRANAQKGAVMHR